MKIGKNQNLAGLAIRLQPYTDSGSAASVSLSLKGQFGRTLRAVSVTR